MPLRKGYSELYGYASQAQRYSQGTAFRKSAELLQKINQLNRLLGEIEELAKSVETEGSAPAREAARKILDALD